MISQEMPAFITPEYKITSSQDTWLISVNTNTPLAHQIKPSIQNEASKSSMLAITYIQQLAKEDVSIAKSISTLYSGYKKYFIDRNTTDFIKICDDIINNGSTETLAKETAHYIRNLLKGKISEKTEGRALAKQIMPSIKQTILMTPPTKVHEEQKISIPEMSAPHNAFPDLIKFKGEYYVCFREALSHVAHNDLGKVRILKGNYNEETKNWNFEHVALLSSDTYDFRDPKFFIDGNQNLRLIIDGSIIDEKETTIDMIPHTASLKQDGKWEIVKAEADKEASGIKGQWIWRVTWNEFDNCGYGFSYDKDTGVYLMKTTDGIKFDKISYISNSILPRDSLNEATIRFKKDGTAVAFIRTTRNGLVATASPKDNYKDWALKIIPFRTGGPNFLISETDLKMWASTRHLFVNPDNTLDEATIFGFMDEKRLVPLLRLKSFSDTSYPGMVMENDKSISIAYYSSQEGNKSDVYIVRLKP